MGACLAPTWVRVLPRESKPAAEKGHIAMVLARMALAILSVSALLASAWVPAQLPALQRSQTLRRGGVVMMGGKNAKNGIFSPAVYALKSAMGEKELNAFRAQIISQHSKVIGKFVDTHESKFGQIALKSLFEAADKDGNGVLDKEEVRSALLALGFSWSEDDKVVDGIVSRADVDDNEVIDFQEFCEATPKTLRVNLIKLAKKNGDDLGFLV